MYFSHVLTLWQKSLSIYETHRVTQEKNGKLCDSNQGSFDYKSSVCSHWLTKFKCIASHSRVSELASI